MAGGRPRRLYLDWLRGIAVLLMIEAHLLDSWTRAPDRESSAYLLVMIVGGMGSTLFLFLAGVAVGLSAGSKARRSGDPAAASSVVVRRGLEIFALAFLFRIQAWILGWSSNPYDPLKVDILNIMGPSIVFTALLWRSSGSIRGRCATFGVATLIVAFLTPLVRTAPIGILPDPIEAYFVPVAGLSNFVFFPWIGLVFAGALAGVLIDDATAGERERRLNVWMGVAGVAIAASAYAGSYLPSIYQHSDFWSSAPTYLFLRLGLALLGVAIAFAWNVAVVGGQWSPVSQLGRTSFFIYWIHVEMVYGLISRPLHHTLTFSQAWSAYFMFCVFMLICSIGKDRAVARFRVHRERAAAVA